MTESTLIKYEDLPCCPEFDTSTTCDVIDMRRRLVFPTHVRTEQGLSVRVEVTLHTRFTRCSGPLALGDIVYTTTLLPGEKVRLVTTDRRSRFSFDSESRLSYRSEQVSEEQYRMRALRAFMADENVVDRGRENYSEQGKWDFHGDASGSIGFLSASADTNARGSHSASSTRDYLHEHRAHAEMADHQSIEATRKAHSLSIGEVSSRVHIEGESQDHFESSSRVFANPNQCHAVTFLFYRINKTETIKFELVSIDRRVLDEAAPAPVPVSPFRQVGQIAAVPQDVPATSGQRLEVQTLAMQSDQQYRLAALQPLSASAAGRLTLASAAVVGTQEALGIQQPLPDSIRAAALKEVDRQLIDARLIEKPNGRILTEARQEFSYERTTAVPTAGVIVKSCMDECGICEPELQRKHKLELERMDLENKLLARQIDLLEKSQEYRCCPADEEEDED
jgi:hypothetical protein